MTDAFKLSIRVHKEDNISLKRIAAYKTLNEKNGRRTTPSDLVRRYIKQGIKNEK